MTVKGYSKVGLVGLLSLLVLVSLIGFLRHQVAQASSNRHYVAPNGDCGGVVSPCYSTIQAAVEAAQPGDTILITKGTYPLEAGRNQVAYVTKDLTVQGGYSLSNWETPDPEANPTILDGTDKGRGMVITSAGQVSVDGLRLVNGNATGAGGHTDGSDAGGGIYIYDTAVHLSHLWVITNTVPISGYGGGIYARSGEQLVEVEDSLVQGNVAMWGSGIYLSDSTSVLRSNTIRDNKYSLSENSTGIGYGAGVGIYGGKARVVGNNIIDNYIGVCCGRGGGLALGNVEAYITDNDIFGNTAMWGGGVYLTGDLPILVNYNTITNNYSQSGGGGAWVESTDVRLNGNLMLGNFGYTGAGAGIVIASNAILTNNVVAYSYGWGPMGFDASGIWINGASPRFYHNTITSNAGDGIYGGPDPESGTYPMFYNMIISNNSYPDPYRDVYGIAVSQAIVDGVLWWGNDHNISSFGTITVTHAITGDPLYVNAPGYDFHISQWSAAIDQGVPTDVLLDMDNQPRLGLPDLGADEYWAPGSFLDSFLPFTLK